MCATPEILVEQNEEGIFRTISLAGTQSGVDLDGLPISPSQARWSQKEIEEQAFVSRYIIDCFKKIRLREYTEIGPKTISTGNLLHLKTEYIVDTKAMDFPQLPGLMLGLLHPTSAVCGTPKQEAIDFISATEKHSRSMYSGYLGPVNLMNATYLFVNLRTVEIKENHAVYYAGCGITEDSDPEKEWQETQMKCQTLQRVLMK
jgi:isochorismate synthase